MKYDVLIVGGVEIHPGPITAEVRVDIFEAFKCAAEDYSEVVNLTNHRKQIQSLRDAFE